MRHAREVPSCNLCSARFGEFESPGLISWRHRNNCGVVQALGGLERIFGDGGHGSARRADAERDEQRNERDGSPGSAHGVGARALARCDHFSANFGDDACTFPNMASPPYGIQNLRRSNDTYEVVDAQLSFLPSYPPQFVTTRASANSTTCATRRTSSRAARCEGLLPGSLSLVPRHSISRLIYAPRLSRSDLGGHHLASISSTSLSVLATDLFRSSAPIIWHFLHRNAPPR